MWMMETMSNIAAMYIIYNYLSKKYFLENYTIIILLSSLWYVKMNKPVSSNFYEINKYILYLELKEDTHI